MCERRYRKDAAHCGSFTFLAMIVPVAMCRTLLTVPPFPWPRSLKTSRSSLFRSSLYSIPISSCAVCLVLSLPTPPGIWRSLSEGATARGAGAAKASPFTFFRFRVRTAPMFSDISICPHTARGLRTCARVDVARRLRLGVAAAEIQSPSKPVVAVEAAGSRFLGRLSARPRC
jgi:hypothetical protein